MVSNTLYKEAPGQVVVGNSNNIMLSNAVVECLPHTCGGGGVTDSKPDKVKRILSERKLNLVTIGRWDLINDSLSEGQLA